MLIKQQDNHTVLTGITKFSFFDFATPYRVYVNRFYGIGDGMGIDTSSWIDKHNRAVFEQTGIKGESQQFKILGIDAHENPIRRTENISSQESQEHIEADNDEDEDIDEDMHIFQCPVPGCTKVYQLYSNLLRHLDIGRHRFVPERITLRDAAIQSYKEHLETLDLTPRIPELHEGLQEAIAASDETKCMEKLQMGWALKKVRKCTRFNENQKSFLLEKFEAGIR